MSLALSFLGGAPFQLLYDGVKEAIRTTRNFRTQLINLEFTLGCLQPRIILQISRNNVQLSLPNDIIQDLQVKMNEGIDLVARLSKLSMWNIRIWGNCCNCLKPNYAEQLEDLDRSLNRLLELLRLEQIRNVTLLMLRLDDIERTQSDILQALQDIPGYISRAQQEVIQRMQANVEQQVRNGEGRAAAPAPVVGVVFGMLFDAVTKVKVKNLMFNRLLGELKYSLDCLRPLIEEIANNNKVLLHLPALELEDFVMEMEKAVEFVRKCSKVSKRANYRKYQWTNKLIQLNEHLQRLFTDFNGQLEWKVKEVMDLVSNMEEMMNQSKGSGTQVVESEGRRSPLPQPHSPSSVRLDYLQHMVGTSTHVITEKTLIDTAENEIYIEHPSDVAKLHVKNVQAGARDVVKETLNSASRDLEMGDASGTEGTSTSTSRNVEETSSESKEQILKRGLGGSAVRMLHNNQTEIVDQHEPPEPRRVQFEVPDDCETRLKGTVDEQKTTIVAEDQKKIKGKNVAVTNEREVAAAAAKLQLFSQKVRRQQLQTVEIKVKMDCDGCERKVRRSVEGMKGVKQVEIDRKASKLTVVGYVEPKKVLARVAHRTGKKVEIWPYVPYNVVANPYVQGVDDKKAPAGHEPSDQQIRYTTAFSDER